MNNEEIKNRVEKIYSSINSLNEELKEIRSKCPHEKSSYCNYMWAPGHIMPANVCDSCGEITSSIEDFIVKPEEEQ